LSKLYNDCVRSSRVLRGSHQNPETSNLGNSQNVGNSESIGNSGNRYLIPPFPPKSLLKLNKRETEKRKEKLQKWLQTLSQLPPSHPAKQQLQNFLWYDFFLIFNTFWIFNFFLNCEVFF